MSSGNIRQHDDGDHGGHLNPNLANAQYLMVAGYMAMRSSLMFFRYRADSMEYYKYGDQYIGTDVPNYWKMANSVRLPACVSIFGILFVLQALSMVGVANEINMLAWMYLVPLWMILNWVAHAIQFLGYDSSWSWYMEDPTTLPNSNGLAVYFIISKEF